MSKLKFKISLNHIVIAISLAMVLLMISVVGFAEQQGSTSVSQAEALPGINASTLDQRIATNKEQLRNAIEAEDEQTAKQLGVTLTQLQERNAKLREIEVVYQRQLTSLKRWSSLKKEEESITEKLETQHEVLISKLPPYSLSLYDLYLDRLTTANQQEATVNIALQLARKGLEEAKNNLSSASQKLRNIKEQIIQEEQAKISLILNWSLEYAKIEEELDQAILDLQKITSQNAEAEERLSQLRKANALKHVNWVRSNLYYDQNDLIKRLDTLEEQRKQLQTRIATLAKEQQEVENVWLKAREVLDDSQGADEIAKARATAWLKAREAWRETYQKVLEQTENIFRILNQEEHVWKSRYELLRKNIDYKQLNNWQNEANAHVENIERLIYLEENYQANLQPQMGSLKKQFSEEDLDSTIKQHLEKHISALRKLSERNVEYISTLQRAKEIEQQFINEIHLRQKNITLTEKIVWMWNKMQQNWEFELWVIDEKSVTIKKVVTALFILIIGMVLVGWIARYFIRHLLSRTRLDESATAAIERILYYIALLLLMLFVLRKVNIPLTAFTFLGGALVIGVGFGTQKLLNNFISGFVLMIERPVKIGDMIEMENNFGIIEDIGSRSTCIRTAGNVHILVPNSSFLEKNIVNWTLSDQEIQAKVTVGVVSKTDTRKVSQLMLKAALDHEKVLRTPEPFVLFSDFSDNALVFDVYFWISMRKSLMERSLIESDIRFRIDDLFRESGIVIANPQRDVHLDMVEPFNFRILKDEDKATQMNGKNYPGTRSETLFLKQSKKNERSRYVLDK